MGLIRAGSGINFNNAAYSYNVITGLNKMTFDNNVGFEKIVLYDNGNVLTNYALGILSNTLYYNSTGVHNFYINGTTTTPILSIAGTGATINGNLNVTGALTVNNIPVISSLASSGLTPTQNSPNTSGLSYTFTVYPYYSDTISICCPIASTASGSFSGASLNVTHTINSMTCQVNKNGSLFINSTVTLNATLPLTKTTTITGNQGSSGTYLYNFKQYFINAIISFTPTIENATNTYTVTFTISGTGTFEYNTAITQTYNA